MSIKSAMEPNFDRFRLICQIKDDFEQLKKQMVLEKKAFRRRAGSKRQGAQAVTQQPLPERPEVSSNPQAATKNDSGWANLGEKITHARGCKSAQELARAQC